MMTITDRQQLRRARRVCRVVAPLAQLPGTGAPRILPGGKVSAAAERCLCWGRGHLHMQSRLPHQSDAHLYSEPHSHRSGSFISHAVAC